MIEISKLSAQYGVRALSEADADAVLALCLGNPQFYEYCAAEPTREQILGDMRLTPPGIDESRKHYVGFYDGAELVAVLDIVDGYPEPEIAFIGFFMMDARFQGRQIGSAIIRGIARYLKGAGKTAIRLAIDKANPQSTHFWKKNGFVVLREIPRDDWTILEAERAL